MKSVIFSLVSMAFLFAACTKEEPRPPKEQTLSQTETPKTGAILIAESKEKLAEAKAKLTQEGKYDCCIKEPCNMCALAEADCECYEDLKKGEHVCIECYSGWQQGKGADEKIKKESVTTSLIKHEHNH